jgi:cytochrome c
MHRQKDSGKLVSPGIRVNTRGRQYRVGSQADIGHARRATKQWNLDERLMMRSWQIAATLLIGSVGIASAQDLAAGEKSFRKCLPCHSIGPDAKNKVGPEQNGLDGRKAGTVDGYSYSDANKNSGIVWSDQTFKDYIADPRAKIPGTKMIFPGIKNPQEATDLWAYIKQFDDAGNIKK